MRKLPWLSLLLVVPGLVVVQGCRDERGSNSVVSKPLSGAGQDEHSGGTDTNACPADSGMMNGHGGMDGGNMGGMHGGAMPDSCAHGGDMSNGGMRGGMGGGLDGGGMRGGCMPDSMMHGGRMHGGDMHGGQGGPDWD